MGSLSLEQQHWIQRKLNIHLPPEIMILILSKLPADEVLRLIYAFKSWASLVHEPFFNKIRWNDRPIRTAVLFLSVERKIDELHICCPTLSGHHYDWIVKIGKEHELGMTNSYNGLVCVYGENAVWVLNPSIRQIIELPEATTPLNCMNPGTYYLGFGFIETTGEYKVIRVFRYGSCEIFTLGCSKNSWRQVADKVPIMKVLEIYISTPIFMNETLHWANYSLGLQPGIVTFNLKHEKFDLIRHPKGRCVDRRHSVLELYGYLCIADLWFNYKTLDIWFMEDYGNRRWAKLFSIDLTEMPNFSKLSRELSQPIGMRDGMIILWNS